MNARFGFTFRVLLRVTGTIVFVVAAASLGKAQASATLTVATLSGMPPSVATTTATSVAKAATATLFSTPSPLATATPPTVTSISATGASFATSAWGTISAVISPNALTATPAATTTVAGGATTELPADECSAAAGAQQKAGVSASTGSTLKTCEGGRIIIEVSSSSRFGNRIGDIIPVNVRIVADSSVTIDFTSLMQGILKFQQQSQVKLALEQPVIVHTDTASTAGKTVYLLGLRVQNFLPIPAIFSLDLHYQLSGLSAAHRKVLTSPDFVLTNSLTVDGGQSLLEGDLSEVPVRQPWAVRPLLVVAMIFIFAPLLYLIRRWYKRSRPSYVPTAIEAAWRVLTPIFAVSNLGFSVSQVSLIEQALRAYLKEEHVNIHSLTRQEIVKLMDADSRRDSVGKILEQCDQILYENRANAESIVMDSVSAIELVHLVQTVIPEER